MSTAPFCHLHCHTQYSLLDGATDISSMMAKAKADHMTAVAMTDHGNMFGCFSFVKEAKSKGLKPILGCEFYMVKDRHKQSFLKSGGEKDERFHQLLLAKNQEGYENLSRLCSLGFIEGLYGKFPRIDKELLLKYHKGLIATSCCIGAEIPQAIIKGKLDEAENLLKWWLDLLGEDFYIEIQRQGGNNDLDDMGISQEQVNQYLLRLAKKYNVKVIATNDVHYLEEEDSVPHDILLCVNTNSFVEEKNRFKFSSSEYFFKTSAQMQERFADVPEAIAHTLEIADKCFVPNLERDILLPAFPVPKEFSDQTTYLRHLVYEGAKVRYGMIDDKLRSRLDFELEVILKMGFAGYFLIVQDFILAARKLGVSVGPGRGSAAGSAVAFCLTITDIDPIKYNLLFERFLNPERISMPDIDIDFDDKGRDKVLDYVVKKYGHNQVAQIVTFGTMAAKSSIRDVARVKQLDLASAGRLAKLVPAKPGIYLKNLLDLEQNISDDLSPEEKGNVQELRRVLQTPGLESEVLITAKKLEGSVRNTGVHAAGVIIAPEDIMKYLPVSTAKDTDLWVTQVEGSVIEYTGMLKMDFLGLTTLTIITDTINNIVKRHGEAARIQLKDIPLDDEKTLELFQLGNTVGIFQFESDGMRGHLKNLRPTGIEDIIAMNALFRPGPMEYIEDFIEKRHHRRPVVYPHVWMEDILKPTYGIMVYQEQIMQAAQIMANYSLGEADILRRAMGKKKKEEMDKQRSLFTERAMDKGIEENQAKEIFDVMAKFASYGFNRSHAAAYSVLAFQTGYLKAHYPAEFMAAVLTANKNNLEDLRSYLNECKMMRVTVLGPDINESELDFTVNSKGEIRFGLSALKGIGEGPVEDLLENRTQKGPFVDFLDMVKRLSSKSFNKKVIESCVYGGAFDRFEGMHRAQYFAPYDKYETYIEFMLKWGLQYHHSNNNSMGSLFGALEEEEVKAPLAPICEPWNMIQLLNYEVEVAGIYLSAHPLDDYRREIKYGASCSIDQIDKYKKPELRNVKIRLCGIITEVQHRTNQKGEGYGSFTLQDYHGSITMYLYKEQYRNHKNLLEVGTTLMVEGTYELDTWRQSDEWKFRVQTIMLLSSTLEYITKKMSLYLNIAHLSDETIRRIDQTCKRNKGHQILKFVVLDTEQEISLTFVGLKKKVNVCNELLADLEDIGLHYKLN